MDISISQYLINKLKQYGCTHVFGIPGTSCADFFFAIDQDAEIQYVLSSNELESGYMADGYGRFGTLGAACVSYGVGTLSLVNAVASAFTEKVPLVLINGGPKKSDLAAFRERGILFSHCTGRENTDFEIFKQITIESIIWDRGMQLDRLDQVIRAAIEYSGPVYIEIPSDQWKDIVSVVVTNEKLKDRDSSPVNSFQEVFCQRLAKAERPAVLIGSEVLRKRLQPLAEKWLEQMELPFATTLLSKSCISESHPQFIGTYDSDLAPKSVRQILEESDCVITIGCIYGVDHTVLINRHYENMIDISYGKGRIGKDIYSGVDLPGFLSSIPRMLRGTGAKYQLERDVSFEARRSRIAAIDTDECTHDSLFAAINKFFQNSGSEYLFVSDTCLGSYPAADLEMPSTNMFLANPVWLSIGQGTPAGAGAYFACGKRPLIITGDGGFQMVAQCYSTMVRYKVPAIVIVIDNILYAIEQFLLDGKYFIEPSKPHIAFNELHPWSYEEFPEVFRGGKGKRVRTISELNEALKDASNCQDMPYIIAAEVSRKDLPAENLQYIKDQHSANL